MRSSPARRSFSCGIRSLRDLGSGSARPAARFILFNIGSAGVIPHAALDDRQARRAMDTRQSSRGSGAPARAGGNEIDPAKERKAKLAMHRAAAEASTLAEFAARYIEEYAKPYKKPRSVEEDERNLRLHVIPALGSLKLKDITTSDIARFHAARRDAPINANRCRALLSHLFKMAEVWGERPPGSNPCRYVGKFGERKRKRFLSAEELSQLAEALEYCAVIEPSSALAAIRLLILTGCRLSEILFLLGRGRRRARLP
jgi:integrase